MEDFVLFNKEFYLNDIEEKLNDCKCRLDLLTKQMYSLREEGKKYNKDSKDYLDISDKKKAIKHEKIRLFRKIQNLERCYEVFKNRDF